MNSIHDDFLEIPINPAYHVLNPLPGSHQELKRKDIRLLSYNIFLRPPPVKNNDSDHKDDRLKEFARILQDFDIICLQEMFGFLNKRKHKLINCANKSGFGFYAESPSPSFFSTYLVDGGLLVLSRFPIVYSEFKSYPYGIFSDSLSQKGVLYTKIQVKDANLHLFSTHTQASYIGVDQASSVITRADQFLAFRKFMEAILKKHRIGSSELVLLVGDFNVDSRNPISTSKELKNYPALKLYPTLLQNGGIDEYEAMKCILSDNGKDKIVDHLSLSYDEHPITYGDSEVPEGKDRPTPKEVALTHKDDLCTNQSLDYIFELLTPQTKFGSSSNQLNVSTTNGSKSKLRGHLKFMEKGASVEKFTIDGQKFKQLSDHYGVSCLLEYTNNVKVPDEQIISPNSTSASSTATLPKAVNLD